MEAVIVVVKIVALLGYLGLSVWWWISWMGMHNNTIDGNSFRLVYPLAMFDERQFNDKGNYWRKQHLYSYGIGIAFSILFWLYISHAHQA